MKSLEICVYSINFLFGLPTHSYVIWLIITGTGSGVASEFFNLNPSICEIGNCLNGLLLVLLIWFSGLLTLKVLITGLAVTGRNFNFIQLFMHIHGSSRSSSSSSSSASCSAVWLFSEL